jgi:hypothetical protein
MASERWTRISARDEDDANQMANRLFENSSDDEMIEICERLSGEATGDGRWSVVITRWTAPTQEANDGK